MILTEINLIELIELLYISVQGFEKKQLGHLITDSKSEKIGWLSHWAHFSSYLVDKCQCILGFIARES